jgi:hypothetical protein
MTLDAEAKAHLSQKHFQKTPWKHDARSRRFSHQKFFGTASPNYLPTTLNREIGPILDQGSTLRCTGYGNAYEGFLIHGIPMNPDWSAAKVGQKQGRTVDESGGDPNATMKSMRDDGFLPLAKVSLCWQSHGVAKSGMTSFYPPLDEEAKKYDVGVGFFKVDGPHDTFDNIKIAIFKAYDPKTKRGQGVDAFGTWYDEWTLPMSGIIPSTYSRFAGYHRYVFFDFCRIDGIEYLKAKNSYGISGNNSIYYFPREVVNREFAKWGTSLKILKTLTPEQLAEAKKTTQLGRLWEAVVQAWYILSERYGALVGRYA